MSASRPSDLASSVGPHRSLWLREALAGENDAPTLQGAKRADIAIIGGGYTGLWTALRIKEAEPGADVAVIEADICGGGASGRNGGQVHSWWERLGALIRICGSSEALRLAHASEAAIDEIAALQESGAIDFHFCRGGWLWTATTTPQMDAWEKAVRLCEKHGIRVFQRLSAEETQHRGGSPVYLGGVLEPDAAIVQPALLARGLRHLAMECGVTIYEHSPVISLQRRSPPILRTSAGALVADRVIIASNAWATSFRELHRKLFIVSSVMIATPPIPDRLHEVGWTRGEAICDSQTRVFYYRTTRDGRIAIGRGGGRVGFGGHISADFVRDSRRARDVVAGLHRLYPMLSDVGADYDWAGPVDRSYTTLPLFGYLGGRKDIVYGVGWSGNGVGPAPIGGRILASLALGRRDEWSECGLVEPLIGSFPPEPFRFMGANVVFRAIVRKGEREERGKPVDWLTNRLAEMVPGQKE